MTCDSGSINGLPLTRYLPNFLQLTLFNAMKRHVSTVATLLLSIFVLSACNIFGPDGTGSDIITDSDGFFYMMDRSNSKLYQLDSQLRERKVWDLSEISNDNIVQGITFDGTHIWISIASGVNRLFKLDLTFDEAEVIQTIVAPPGGRGTIRDITFDGTHLWAVNSGSVSATEAPAIYKLNPETAEIVASYDMPTTEIRSVSYIPPNGDVYGRGAPSGIYMGDRESNKFWNFRFDRPVFTDAFDAPVGPEGQFRVFPSGLTYELMSTGEIKFWTINSSLGANYLYRLSRTGSIEERFEIRHYSQPGPVVFTAENVAIPAPPEVQSVVPNRGALNTTLDIEISGSGFRAGTELAVDFGENISVSNVVLVSAGIITATINIAGSATLGNRDVLITSGDGQIATLESSFEVTAEPPRFGYLYVADFGSLNFLYRIREADGGLEQQWDYSGVAPGGSLQGITHDGEHLWIAAAGSDRLIRKLDTSGENLVVLESIPAPYPSGTGTVRDLAFHEGSLWTTNSGDNMIYQLDVQTGEIVREIDAPGDDTRTLTFVDGVLFVADRSLGRVYSFSNNTETWNLEFEVPMPTGTSAADRLPVGMDWDGETFWIATTRLANDYVLQVSRDGELLRSFTSPNAGPDILSGLAFVLE